MCHIGVMLSRTRAVRPGSNTRSPALSLSLSLSVSVNVLAEIHSCQATTSQPPPQIRVTITTTGVGDLLRTTQQLLPRINSPATLNIIRLGNTPNGPAD
jgi:hypothetical protein